MIYVTGDTHGSIDFDKLKIFANLNPQLTREDYVIIAGDFGGVWSKDTLSVRLSQYTSLAFTVLFVDGNHENFDLIDSYPVKTWKGGKVHFIAENVIHLMRGQVYEIDGKTIFTFGGATSSDKQYRTEGLSWWRQELPTDQDMLEANKNLEKVGFKVDYIITHSCDERALYYPPLSRILHNYVPFPENGMLSYFEEKVTYKHWYFGHYHLDADLTDKKTVLYQSVVPIDGCKEGEI